MDKVLEILGQIGFDPQLAIINIANFALVLWILNRFVFSKLGKVFDERRNQINQANAQSEEVEKKLEKAKIESDKIIEEAKTKATVILEEAHESASNLKDEMVKKTDEQIEQLFEKNKKQMQEEGEKMKEEIRKDAVDLVVAIAEKVVGSAITEDIDKDVIKNSLKDL